jgi:hypothetical protein
MKLENLREWIDSSGFHIQEEYNNGKTKATQILSSYISTITITPKYECKSNTSLEFLRVTLLKIHVM